MEREKDGWMILPPICLLENKWFFMNIWWNSRWLVVHVGSLDG